MRELPLVSCIMPTHDRRRFVPLAIAYFLRQDYPRRELILVDDGSDAVADLVPADPAIRYIRLEHKRSIGASRNLACEQARGEIIAHWDDDDWYAPHRLRYQVEGLLSDSADVVGASSLLYFQPEAGKAWRYTYPADHRPWVAGNTLCYTRAFWEHNRFADVDVGEDAHFVWSEVPKRLVALPDDGYIVALIHGSNVSPKRVTPPYWQPAAVEEVQARLGDDLPRYLGAAAAARSAPAAGPAAMDPAPAPAPTARPAPAPAEVDLTVAREEHLALPEFAAFNHGQNLPRMRRWELPFALTQARLQGTMAVLDCTINPCSFEARLHELYPHVLYRHAPPLQGDRFALPLGVPDAAFDRVVCINTLEHLTHGQRRRWWRPWSAT